jgi:hypothetical protein
MRVRSRRRRAIKVWRESVVLKSESAKVRSGQRCSSVLCRPRESPSKPKDVAKRK